MSDPVNAIVEQVTHVRDLLDDVVASARSSDEVAGRCDDRLRALLLGLERAHNAAEAAQADVMVAMGREAQALDAAERAESQMPTRSHEEFVPDEIAVLLSCTKALANLRYNTAWQAMRHPAMASAWRSGSIDARKVSVIGDQLQHLPAPAAEALLEPAIEYARARTPMQTREWLRRRVIAIDPETAEVRRKAAVEQRRVVVTPAEDGMSELWAWLPSIQARQIQQTLTRLAHDLGANDARTMDQRRSDAFVDLLLGRITAMPVDLQVIVPVDTLTAAADQPGWVPGLGPITAQQTREMVTDPSSAIQAVRALITEPTKGTLRDVTERHYRPSLALERAVRARDVTCRFPGCRRAASGNPSGTDLDHTVPWPMGPTSATNLAVLCRRHHRLKHQASWRVSLLSDGTMLWTTPTGRRYQSDAWQYTDPTATASPPKAPDPPPLE